MSCRALRCLAISLILACGDASAGKPGFFGINHPFEFVPASTHGADLQAMAETGVESVRVSIHWKRIERSRGVYDFEATDAVIEAAHRHGIRPLASIVNLPDWATVSKNKLDLANLAQFGEFVTRCVRRYKDRVREWEIWNEPNNAPFWEGTAEDYTELLKVAYAAIKKEDPGAVVIGLSSGSLGTTARPDRWTFVERVLAGGGGHFLDAVSVHPYRDLYGPDVRNSPGKYPSRWTQYEEISRLESLLAHFGLRKDIYVTELGWPDINGEDVQAAYLARSYVTFYAFPSVQRFCWFFWREGTYNAKNFGLMRADMTPKAARDAYRRVSTLLRDADFRSRRATDDLIVYEFEKAGKTFWVLWSPDNRPRKIDVNSITGNARVRAQRLYGGEGLVREPYTATRDPLVLLPE